MAPAPVSFRTPVPLAVSNWCRAFHSTFCLDTLFVSGVGKVSNSSLLHHLRIIYHGFSPPRFGQILVNDLLLVGVQDTTDLVLAGSAGRLELQRQITWVADLRTALARPSPFQVKRIAEFRTSSCASFARAFSVT